jgi:hypothetical protein
VNPVTKASGSDAEELVYAAAILILSHDLYPRKLEVVREYIQNASDAIDAFTPISDAIEDRSEPVIKLSVQQRSLLIFDNGLGMDAEEIYKLKRIAYSEKKVGEEAGYKGIGRLAGIAVADKLKISSTSYGDPVLHHFEFRAKEMREEVSENKKKGIQEPATAVINRHTSLWSVPTDPKDHHTMVEIRGISELWPELLDTTVLKEYVGDIAPVEFSPEFTWGTKISQRLRQSVSDYSPKTIYLSFPNGERVRIYKPYTNDMKVAEPDYFEVVDQANPNKTLAFCWYATKGQQILDQIRPAGKIFTVDGDDAMEKKRFAGLVYKLFGFSIGDRSLTARTLWGRSGPRALWFTGEIHIIDKDVSPTTDRSDFVENEPRKRLYQGAQRIPLKLNKLAQKISDNRKAFDDAQKFQDKLQNWKERLDAGRIERSELKSIRRELNENLSDVRKRSDKCSDGDIQRFDKDVLKYAATVQKELDKAKSANGDTTIADVAAELKMTTQARRVFQIVMDALEEHYSTDLEDYYEVSGKIIKALRKKF